MGVHTAATHLTHDQENFLKLVAGPALDAERRLRIPAAVIVAQAILESGWGKSRLFTEAHNPFGIKDLDLPDDYGEYLAPTIEYVHGNPSTVLAAFEKFRSLDDAFFHHALLFWRSKRYWPAIKAWLLQANLLVPRDARGFARMIGPCGYATDPNYGEKLVKLIDQFQLDGPTLNYYAGAGAAVRTPVEGMDT